MTPYGTLHLAVALFCGFVALFHAVLWIFVPPDRTQLWGAIGFAGFFLMNLGVAGSGAASGAALGDPRAWVVLGIAGGTSLWWSLMLGGWSVLGQPLTAARRRALAAVALLAIARAVDVGAAVYRGAIAAPVTWESALNAPGTFLRFPAKLTILGLALFFVVEAVLAVRRKNLAGIVALVTAAPSLVLFSRELLISMGFFTGPSLLGLAGVPLAVTMSMVIGVRYVAATRSGTHADSIGGYRLLCPLGAGGMGELFLAEKTGPGGFARHVALKMVRAIFAGGDEGIEKLLAEARIAARLSHPNIIAVHDVGRLVVAGEPRVFIAMEYLAGVNLAQIRNRAREERLRLPVALVVDVATQVARGLAYAHAAGIVHRDVSPHNMMVTFEGAVKLIDFGLAQEGGAAELETVAGKSGYLAPERLAGKGAGTASDVFGLGVCLYELLVGERPFRGETPREIALAIRSGKYVPVGERRPEVPASLLGIVERALRPDPAARFPDGEEIARALEQVRATLAPLDVGGFARRLCFREWTAQLRIALSAGVDDRTRAPIAPALRRISADRAEETLERA